MLTEMRESSSRSLAIMVLTLMPACAGSTVEYANGKCLIDGASATLTQVESRQAEMTQELNQKPCGIPAGARTLFERHVRFLNSRLHANEIANVLL